MGDLGLVWVVKGVGCSVRRNGVIEELIIGLGLLGGGVILIKLLIGEKLGVLRRGVCGTLGGFEFVNKCFAGILAEMWGFVEGFGDDVPDLGVDARDLGGLSVHDGVGDGDYAIAGERLFAGDHLVEDDAEGKDIGAGVDIFSVDLFGRHIGWRSEDLAVHSDIRFECEAGDSEIGEFDCAVFENLDIFGFDIAVDDAVGVGEGESFGDFDRDFAGVIGAESALFFDSFSESLTVQELHCEVVASGLFGNIVDGYDVGVDKGSGGFCFAHEALDTIFFLLGG